MKTTPTFATLVFATFFFAACSEQKSAERPAPHTLTTEAMGHYCGMGLMEHTGPKGQIILASQSTPVWFSSARDAFSYTMLDEEAKDVRAVYVSDMGQAPTWENPGADNWIEARGALFVIESRMQGGMGAPETIPFSDRSAAEAFVAKNGGRIVAFADVPQDYVLSSQTGSDDADGSTAHDHGAGSHR